MIDNERGSKVETAWEYICRVTEFVWSRERPGFASRSEKKRWLQNKAVWINGEPIAWDAPIDFPVNSIVLFPKGKHKTTIW